MARGTQQLALNRLEHVSEQLRWAYSDGYLQGRNAGYDKPKVQNSHMESGPDEVNASKYDLGIGNHKARAAWQNATRRLNLLHASYYNRLGVSAPSVPWEQLCSRLAFFVRHYGVGPKVLGVLAGVEASLGEALQEDSLAHADKPVIEDLELCANCERQPASKTGRCETCYRYWNRRKQERPSHLWEHEPSMVHQAREAQAKRGKGYGMS